MTNNQYVLFAKSLTIYRSTMLEESRTAMLAMIDVNEGFANECLTNGLDLSKDHNDRLVAGKIFKRFIRLYRL